MDLFYLLKAKAVVPLAAQVAAAVKRAREMALLPYVG